MVKLHHTALSIAAVTVAGIGAFAVLPASAAGASTSAQHPAHRSLASKSVISDCGYGRSHGNQWVCVAVSADPYYVQVSDGVRHATRSIAVCLRKDGLPDRCTPFVSTTPGESQSAVYDYQGPGRYCAVAYRLNRHGGHTEIAKQCVRTG